MSKTLKIGPFDIANRLFVGTGKYATYELMRDALAESGCEVVTVAVRRERSAAAMPITASQSSPWCSQIHGRRGPLVGAEAAHTSCILRWSRRA